MRSEGSPSWLWNQLTLPVETNQNNQTLFEERSACQQPKSVGPCRMSLPRFYFDSETDTCTQFMYGGCGGNENLFESEEECIKLCKQTRTPRIEVPTAEDECSLSPEMGPCRASLVRYYHDSKTGQCAKFTFGGCRGNGNNFLTELDCKNACITDNSVKSLIYLKSLASPDINKKRSYEATESDNGSAGTVLSMNQETSSSNDFEGTSEDSSWTLVNFEVVKTSDKPELTGNDKTGAKVALLGKNKVGEISKEIHVAAQSQLEVDFSLFINGVDGSKPKFNLYLEPSPNQKQSVFSLDPGMPVGEWKRYRYSMKTITEIPSLRIIFSAETTGSYVLALDNIFLGWKDVLRHDTRDLETGSQTTEGATTLAAGEESSTESTTATTLTTTPVSTTTTTSTTTASAEISTESTTMTGGESSTESTTTTTTTTVATMVSTGSTTTTTAESSSTQSTTTTTTVTESTTLSDETNVNIDIEKLNKFKNGTVHIHNEFHIENSHNFSINVQVP